MKFERYMMLLFIDAYLDEYETIAYPVLQYHFGVSRSSFTSLMNEYSSERPAMIRYVSSEYAYRRSLIFERRYNVTTTSLDILESYTVLTRRPVLTLNAIRTLPTEDRGFDFALDDAFED